MENNLQILIHALSKDIVRLVEANLRESNISFDSIHSDSEKDFRSTLKASSPHIVIAGHHQAGPDAPQGLALLREYAPHTPLIVILNTPDEKISPSLIRSGVTDCVSERHLSRIGTSVIAALARKQTEDTLRQNQEMFQIITDNVSDLIAVMDVNGKRLYDSKSYQSTFGSTLSAEGKDSFGEIHPADRDHVQRVFRETAETGVGNRIQFRFVRNDGNVRYIESLGSVVRNSAGKVDKVLVVSRDITEQREAENQLRMLAYALSGTKDCVALTDLEDTTLFVNEAFLQTYGLSEEEVLGRNITQIRGLPTREGDAIRRATVKNGAWSGEIFNKKKEGSQFPVELWSSLVKDNEENPVAIVGIARDISERKKNEAALLESEERYRLFFEEDLTGDFISTPEGHLLACNPAFVKMFGFSSVEDAMKTNLARLYLEKEQRGEFVDLIRKNRKLEYYETELRRQDGTALFIVENAIGIFDEDNKLVRIKGYIFDNTRRKELEDQLLHSQKMEAVGQLAAGIAHEFNNVLTTILAAAETVKSKTDDQTTHSLARMIESSAVRGGGIAKQLLQFSRAKSSRLVPTSVPQVVMDVWKILEHSFPKTIRIAVETSVIDGYTLGDPAQLQQMLLNLCLNARDAMTPADGDEPAGFLTISLETATTDFVERRFGKKGAESYIIVCVADSGHGMDADVQRRIFEPFFSTKGIGKGTGLGLSIVHGIVGSHGGFIDVETSPGQGSKFIIYLPAVVYMPTPPQVPASETPEGKGECILVVEDDESVRSLLNEWITQAGYEILEADDGAEALRIYNNQKDKIDLVLTDIGLPKLGGAKLFRELRLINPTVPVLFCTGFIEEEKGRELLQAGAAGIIQKPFRSAEILTHLREALDSVPTRTAGPR